MHMKHLGKTDFTTMLWQNGGGRTQQLYCVRDEDEDILFRLSRASVNQDGPFSLLPGIDRILLVLQGEGLLLDMAGEMLELRPDSDPLRFAGEVPIHCDLLEGPVEDFNVMVDRSYGHAELSVHYGPLTLEACDCACVYHPSRDELWVLEDEAFDLELRAEERVLIVRVSRS